jgi:preprotein translocase subunit YajC
MLIVMVPLFLVMYFFMIRPQKKQEKQIAEMRNSLMIGDEICTNGGLIGRVAQIKDDILTLELNRERTKIKVYRWAVREVVNPMPRPESAAPAKSDKKDEKKAEDAPEIKE